MSDKELIGDREPLVKAAVFGSESRVQMSNVQSEEDRVFVSVGALPPPYDPALLCTLLEHSNALRQNVDAYSTNIDAFGHRFEAILDLDASDVSDKVRTAMEAERRVEGNPSPVTDEEVAVRLKAITLDMRMEKARIETFFEFCCTEMSYPTLRRRTRQDVEVTGNGYWEVLRNAAGEIAQFVYIPSFTMRLLPLGPTPVPVTQNVKVNPLKYETRTIYRRLRKYVQIFETRTVYFKEFGDPRVMSRRTGTYYDTLQALTDGDHDDGPATEVIHFKVFSPRSPYGVPRWIGALLSVLGSRQAEEVNFLYFDNKSVPPLALLVSGGRLSEETVKRLQDFVETEIKGKRNFHKILVLDAEQAGGGDYSTGRMKIAIQPLTGAQHNDALFQGYDERNMDKVGMTFRLPRMLRGDIRDFNRATADAALSFAETQVFSPEREEFDFVMNRYILSTLSIRYWKFRSNAPSLRDPVELAPVVQSLVMANVLTPEEGRQLAEGVFNREFKKIDSDWVKQPVSLTLAGYGQEGPAAPPVPGAPAAQPTQGRIPAEIDGWTTPNLAKESGAICVGDMPAGVKVPAQDRRLRRLPPEMKKRAEELVAFREALVEVEKDLAVETLKADKAAERGAPES